MRTPKEELAKLPKWAQNRIEKLEADVEYYNQHLSQMAGEGETNTFIQAGLREDDKPLPKDTRVSFAIPKGRVDCSIRDGKLEVYGNEPLALYLRSSNVLSVDIAK